MSRSKPSGSALTDAQTAVLEALQRAYPDAIPTTEILERFGVGSKTRIQELQVDGYHIESVTLVDGRPGYQLTSRKMREPRVIQAGVIIRIDSRDGYEARTHGEARASKVVAPDVLAEAQEAAEKAYRAVLVARGYGHLLGVPSVQKPHTLATMATPAPTNDWDDPLAEFGAIYGDH